jgi:hypothetical protein
MGRVKAQVMSTLWEGTKTTFHEAEVCVRDIADMTARGCRETASDQRPGDGSSIQDCKGKKHKRTYMPAALPTGDGTGDGTVDMVHAMAAQNVGNQKKKSKRAKVCKESLSDAMCLRGVPHSRTLSPIYIFDMRMCVEMCYYRQCCQAHAGLIGKPYARQTNGSSELLPKA